MAQDVAAPLEFENETPPRISAPRRALQLTRRHPLGAFGLLVIAVLLFAAAYVMANLVVDVLYGWLDPRIRYG